jgi:hypothetical protein
MLPQSSYTIKARTWPVWIIFCVIGIPAVILIFTEPGDKAGPYLFIAACLLCAILFGLNRTMKIELDDERLVYSAYGKKRSIRWNDVTTSSLSWSIEEGHTASYNWSFLMTDGKDLHIPLGYYSRSDMRALANQAIDRAKNAVLSKTVHQIVEGKFPWFLF